jgi:hypothetical protein
MSVVDLYKYALDTAPDKLTIEDLECILENGDQHHWKMVAIEALKRLKICDSLVAYATKVPPIPLGDESS